MSDPKYDLEWILPFVRAALQNVGNLQYRNFAINLWQKLEAANTLGVVRSQHPYSGSVYDFDNAPYALQAVTTEAFFYLVHRGYISPQPPGGTLNHPTTDRYDVTDRGREWFNGGEPYPEESRSYLLLLRQLVPNPDPIVEQYVVEALTAFEREAHFAASVMLGAASEKAIYLLAESLIGALSDAAKKRKLQTIFESRSLLKLLEAIRDTIDEAGKGKRIPYPVFEGAATNLMSLFDAIRKQRNDSVHPMNAIVSVNSVRHLLKAFPYALAKCEDLRGWFIANRDSV